MAQHVRLGDQGEHSFRSDQNHCLTFPAAFTVR
jgi:hypothetical protein